MDQSLKVLVVDDSSLYRRILTSAVTSIPIPTEVEIAPTGSVALKKIPPFGPDIVLLDIEMPEMSGIEVLKAIKRDYADIAVVLVSGVNSRSADITMEGLSSGASDFIPKPTGSSLEENTKELQRELRRTFDHILNRRLIRQARSGTAPTPAAAPVRQTPPPPRRAPSILPWLRQR